MPGAGEQRGKPTLLDNIEGFFRGIVEGLDDPKPPVPPAENPTDGSSREVGRTVQEVRRGDYIFRRTTIDEVIFDPSDQSETDQER
ncbi:MAG: hypothetical protein GC172_09075 [Phycisphaera sp.]|nr:hypothetical protein [Phycisphaera sp.]